MPQFTRFLIVGMQRSGTTVTHHYLGGHPQVSLATDEVFVDPFFSRGLSVFTTGRESFDSRCLGYRRLFDAICLGSAELPIRAAGLKVALSSAEDAMDLVECVRDYFEDLKIIVVRRADLVAQAGSLFRARATGQWHAFGRKVGERGVKVDVSIKEFDVYVRECRGINAQLDRLNVTHQVCEMLYERDIEGGLDQERLFDFIGVDRLKATWMEMQKVSPSVETFIANHAQLLARLPKIPVVTQQMAEAAAVVRQKVRVATEQPYLLVYRAEERLRRGRLQDAKLDISGVLARSNQLEPWLAGRASGLARTLLECGAGCGEGVVDALAELHADDGSFYLHRAEIEFRFGLVSLSLKDLRFATLGLGYMPQGRDQEWVFWLIEEVLLAQWDGNVAEDFAADLMSRYPLSAPAWFLRALVACKAGRSADAVPMLQQVLKIDPCNARANRLRADIG